MGEDGEAQECNVNHLSYRGFCLANISGNLPKQMIFLHYQTGWVSDFKPTPRNRVRKMDTCILLRLTTENMYKRVKGGRVTWSLCGYPYPPTCMRPARSQIRHAASFM